MRTVHGLSDESGTCGWPKPIDPVQIIAKKNVWCVDTRTHVVNHWCKEHCVINNDVNLKFCRDNRVCGSCTLWGVMYSWWYTCSHSVKCLSVKCLSVDCPFDDLSFGEVSFGEVSFGEVSFGELSFGEWSVNRRPMAYTLLVRPQFYCKLQWLVRSQANFTGAEFCRAEMLALTYCHYWRWLHVMWQIYNNIVHIEKYSF